MNKKVIWGIIIVAIIILAAVWYLWSMNQGTQPAYIPPAASVTSTPSPVPPVTTSSTSTAPASAAPVVGPGEHCGGNTLNAPVCEPGYYCAPSPTSNLPFGDVGGVCMPVGGKG